MTCNQEKVGFERLEERRSRLEEKFAEAEMLHLIVNSMVEQRIAKGLSQRELAEKCGIPQSSVARIESNKNIPNLITLLKIFRQLDLRLAVVPQLNADEIKENR